MAAAAQPMRRNGVRLAAAILLMVAAFGIGLAPALQAQVPSPSNDEFLLALDLDGVDGFQCPTELLCQASLDGSNDGATVEEGEPQEPPCDADGTVWYRFDVTEAAQVTLRLEANFAPALAAFTGTGSIEDLAAHTCEYGDLPMEGEGLELGLTFDAGPGTWWIRVGGLVSEAGPQAGGFTLNVTLDWPGATPVFAVLPDSPTLRVNEKAAFTIETADLNLQDVEWDFGDGGTGQGFTVRHRWTAPGAHALTATGVPAARDGQEIVLIDEVEPVDEGDPGPAGPTDNTTVTVVAAPLTAAFHVEEIPLAFEPCECELAFVAEVEGPGILQDPMRVLVGQPVLFVEDAFGGNGALNFTWAFGDGATAWESEAVHAFDTIGDRAVRLTVRDASGTTRSLQRTVHVYDIVPFSGAAEGGGNTTMPFEPYGLVSCAVAVNGTSVDFDGWATVATSPAGLGDGSGPLSAIGVVLVSFTGGPDPGQCERVTIVLGYDASTLPISESRLAPFYWTGAAWKDLRSASGGVIAGAEPEQDLRVFSSRIDQAGDRALLVTNHTSSYGIAGIPFVGGGGGPGSQPAAEAPSDDGGDDGLAGDGDGPGDGSAADGASDAGDGAESGPVADVAPSTVSQAQLVVRRAGAQLPGSDLGGLVHIGLEGASDAATFVAVAQDGTETDLGAAPAAEWDTSAMDNGVYRLEARRSDGSVLASSTVVVFNARVPVEAAVAAMLVGAGVMVAGFALSLFLGAAQEAAVTVAEDKFRERTKRLRFTQWVKSLGTTPSLLVGAPLLAAFFAFDGLDRLDVGAYLERLPLVLAAAIPLFLLAYFLELLINRASGARSEFHLLPTGALAMAASSLLFRMTFGYPGFVEEEEGARQPSRRALGLRSLALLGVLLALFVPFALLGHLWRFDLGEEGMAIALTILATSSLPFQPVPGAAIWAWNKAVSIAALASTFGLLLLFQVAWVPLSWIAAAGVLGAVGYGVALLSFLRPLRSRPEAPPMPSA